MRLSTIALIATIPLGTFAATCAAGAQQPAKVPRIGILEVSSASASPHRLEAFRRGLRDLGYVEGRNIAIELRFAEGKLDRLPGLAGELIRLKVDVIVAAATPSALAAKNATGTIPIVFSTVADPVGLGLVASLARPGGNITGLTPISAELSAKRLELLKEIVPRVSRIAVLSTPDYPLPVQTEILKEMEAAARSLGLQLQILEVRSPNDLDSAFGAMNRERAGAFTVLPIPMFVAERRRIVDLAAKTRLPAVFHWREYVEAGGLMSYGPNPTDLSRRAATYVDKILKGAKPADLPVEQPTRFELVINRKTAKALGLTIPQSILIRADQVIQ